MQTHKRNLQQAINGAYLVLRAPHERKALLRKAREYFIGQLELLHEGVFDPVADVENGPHPSDCDPPPTPRDLWYYAWSLIRESDRQRDAAANAGPYGYVQ